MRLYISQRSWFQHLLGRLLSPTHLARPRLLCVLLPGCSMYRMEPCFAVLLQLNLNGLDHLFVVLLPLNLILFWILVYKRLAAVLLWRLCTSVSTCLTWMDCFCAITSSFFWITYSFYLKPYTECNGLYESSLDQVALARAGSSGGECWAGYPRAPVKCVT